MYGPRHCGSFTEVPTHVWHVQVRKKVHTKPWSESNALAFLDDLCNPKHLNSYEFIPPKMVKGCQAYLDKHGDEFQDALAVGGAEEDMRHTLCGPLCDPFDITFEKPAEAKQRPGMWVEHDADAGKPKPKSRGKKGKKKLGAKPPSPETEL
jgi:hypothetical protein